MEKTGGRCGEGGEGGVGGEGMAVRRGRKISTTVFVVPDDDDDQGFE